LQRLDVPINFSNHDLVKSGKVFYAIDNFAGVENKIDGSPIIYIPEKVPAKHPSHKNITEDLQTETERIGGIVVGYLSNTKTIDGSNGSGEPRVTSLANITCEKVNNLISEGKLSLSTGFNAHVNPSGSMLGKIDYNHTLIFHRGKCDVCYPNDPGAHFDNLIEMNNLVEVELNNVVPPHTLQFGLDYSGKWRKLQLNDFTTKQKLSELNETKRNDIAAHFAYSSDKTFKNFADMKFGHHSPKTVGLGAVNRSGVINAMRAVNSPFNVVNISEEERRQSYAHLLTHCEELGISAPEFDNLTEDTEMTDETKEVSLDAESKGLFKTLIEKIEAGFSKTDVQNTINNSDAPEMETKPEEKMDNIELNNLKTEFDTVKADLVTKQTEMDNLISDIATKEATIAELTEKATEFDNLKLEIKKTEADAKWTEFKNTAELPAAWLEDEPKLREEMETDPQSFMIKLLEFKNTVESKVTKAEGSTEIGNTIETKEFPKYDYNKGSW